MWSEDPLGPQNRTSYAQNFEIRMESQLVQITNLRIRKNSQRVHISVRKLYELAGTVCTR